MNTVNMIGIWCWVVHNGTTMVHTHTHGTTDWNVFQCNGQADHFPTQRTLPWVFPNTSRPVLGVILDRLILDHNLRSLCVILELWSRSLLTSDLWLWFLITFSMILILTVKKRSDHINSQVNAYTYGCITWLCLSSSY